MSVTEPVLCGRPRRRVPQRNQVAVRFASLDEMLDVDHPVRAIWTLVCGLDLSAWLKEFKAVEGHVGRNGTDPRLLVAVWVYATVQGIASARRLAEMCEKHLTYRWLCGGVTVNYHLLADFRSQGGQKWDDLLTQIVGVLMMENLVTLHRVAQDGMRVRASAGKSSFRRKVRLQACLDEAREQVETLRELAEENAEELSRRQLAAQKRGARERQERLEAAICECEKLQQYREEMAPRTGHKVTEARASSTDPEARTMKFANGGYGPGYNVQFSTDTAAGVIVGVDVTNAGTDNGELPPMLDQVEERYDRDPEEVLVDGGFTTKEAIADATENHGCTIFAPLREEKKQQAAGRDPHARKKGDSDAVADWRQRMGTDLAKAIYKLRGQTAEWVNAMCRNHGLQQMPVRGIAKCRGIALLHAITHNLLRALRLRAEVAMNGS